MIVFVGARDKHVRVQTLVCELVCTPEHDHAVPGFAARTSAHWALEYPIPNFDSHREGHAVAESISGKQYCATGECPLYFKVACSGLDMVVVDLD